MMKRRLLYIVSPGFSGSTLTTLLIATHPRIATIGERFYLRERLTDMKFADKFCTCGVHMCECEFLKNAFDAGHHTLPWYLRNVNYPAFEFSRNKRVNRRIRRAADGYVKGKDMSRIHRRIATRPYRALCEANAALVDFVLESRSADVLIDSSKSTPHVGYLEASGLFDITPIHLSRDGRGQYLSALRRYPDWPPEEAPRRFVKWIDRIERVLDRRDRPYIRLKYEDLCERPLQELRRIADEAGLDPDGMSLDFRDRSQHVIGNWGVVKSETLEIVNEERWKTELTPDQLDIFERIAGDANRSLGYGA